MEELGTEKVPFRFLELGPLDAEIGPAIILRGDTVVNADLHLFCA